MILPSITPLGKPVLPQLAVCQPRRWPGLRCRGQFSLDPLAVRLLEPFHSKALATHAASAILRNLW